MKKIFIILVLIFGITPAHANNGKDATGDPKVVALIHWNSDNTQGCSGALVAPRIVFTAAHCLSRMPKSGKWQPDYDTELPVSGMLSDKTPMWVLSPGEKVYLENNKPNINRVKVIAQFASTEYKDSGCLNNDKSLCHGSINDFGVLILEKPLGNSYFKYASKEIVQEMVLNKSKMLALGYGRSSGNDIQPNPNFMEVTANTKVMIQNNSFCILTNNKYCEGSNLVVHAKNKVGEHWGGGDSGSPLWYFYQNEWLYVGAMSGSAGCSAEHYPNGPTCRDKWWNENGYGEYWTAFSYNEVILKAELFLKTQEDNENKTKEKLLPNPEIQKQTNIGKQLKCKHNKRNIIMSIKGKKCPNGYSFYNG